MAARGNRDSVVVATKVSQHPEFRGLRPANLKAAAEASLRRLGTDRIDLYHQHGPDADTPIEETLEALTDLVRAGTVLYLANSNFASWQLAEADHTARERGLQRFTGAQIEWNLLTRDVEREIVPACARYGLGVIPYFPLASGLLSGKYRRGEDFPEGSRLAAIPYFAGTATDDNWGRVERLTEYAAKHDRSLLELAMSWLASQPVVSSVIAGATRPDQVRSNAEAASWKLTGDQLAEIDELLK
jgi:aryl-alcohol dehydrogenase-like predicted oxidoreductase